MSNNYEQPVEPMSRAEDILRGDTANVPQSRVEDLLIQLIEQGGGSSGVIVTPILESGVKIASISVDGALVDIYAPNDTVGSIVSISTIQQTGTKIATLTIDGHDYDIYAPAGGSSNLYGTTAPTSDQGSNGDIYMQYQGGSEPVEGDWETIPSTSIRTTSGATLVSDFDPTSYKKIKFSGYYSIAFGSTANKPFTTSEIQVDDIPSYSETGLLIANDYIYVKLGEDGDSLYAYSSNGYQFAINQVDATPLTIYPPKITNVYGKVEDEWVGFPEEGYEETTLWEGSQSITQYSAPFTIPDIGMAELNKYDAFAFDFYSTYSITRTGIMLTSSIKDHKDAEVTLTPDPTDAACPLFMHYDSTNDILKAVATTNHGYTLTKVIGIKYGKGGGSGSSSLNYSTAEQVVGTWVDGKPLYQKTIVYSSGVTLGPTATILSTTEFTEFSDIDTFINGFACRLDTGSSGAAATNIGVYKDGSNLKVYSGITWNNMTHFTFQYTKTTD